jgi:putative ABC transport system ATP-binding protein
MIYQLRDLAKIRAADGVEFRLVVPRLHIDQGEMIALVGPSGCGKSTLLDMLAMVLSPSWAKTFTFTPKGSRTSDLGRIWNRNKLNRLSELRKRHIGYVLQTGGLLSYLTVKDNISLSRRLLAQPDDGTFELLVTQLGIDQHLNKLPASLSVGERQRVAIARALVHRPSIVIADEPTASLDPLNAEKTMSLFLTLAEELGLTVIMATHDSWLLEKLGLRQISHTFGAASGSNATESVFEG